MKRTRTMVALLALSVAMGVSACDGESGSDAGSGLDAGSDSAAGDDAGPSDFDPLLVQACEDLCGLVVGTTCSSACDAATCEDTAIMARTGGCEAEYGEFMACATDAADLCDAFQGSMGSCGTEFSAWLAVCP